MTQNADERQPADAVDRHEVQEIPADPDDQAVDNFLTHGPQGPQGRVEMAAAGIDVDRKFPTDPAENHPGETTSSSAEGRPSQAFIEEGNTWEGDGPVSPTGQFPTPDPRHAGNPGLVVADPEAARESAAATGSPVAREALLTTDAEQAFLGRWDDIQIGFVEGPAQSVRDADVLIQDIASAYHFDHSTP